MKIFLLGATGRTGKHVVEICLKKGIEVNCLVRDPSKITPADGLTIHQGDVSDNADLLRSINGCDHIINVLNISRNSDFPWSKLRSPKTLLSDTMRQIIAISEIQKISKIVVCSAWGVAESRADIPFWFRWLIDYSNIGIAYNDHEKQEEILQSTELNYTIVRPVALINAKKLQQVQESFDNKPKPGLVISRKAVANYLIDSLIDQSLDRKIVTISKN